MEKKQKMLGSGAASEATRMRETSQEYNTTRPEDGCNPPFKNGTGGKASRGWSARRGSGARHRGTGEC